VTRILAVADEEDNGLTPARLSAMRPDLVVACGDLHFDYLDYIVSATNAPIVFVPGNHDPEVRGPSWCTSADGRVVRVGDVVAAGLGGSMRYNVGPNQYTELEMHRRATRLAARARMRGRRVDLLLTHAAPLGLGDGDDPCHRGFACFHRLVEKLAPRYHIHGHIHPYGHPCDDRKIGATTVINAIPHRLIELNLQERDHVRG
jgi:Icc-related predicted phosphoesterase